MIERTPGKVRGIDELCTDEGVIAVLAIDHRDSLRAVLSGEVTDEEITEFKLELIAGIGSRASGVMLEPEYSLPHALLTGALSGSSGFMAALEAQGYMQDPWAGPTQMMPGWSAAEAKRMGASAAKLLLPYHPDRTEHAGQQIEVARQTVGTCRGLDLALLVEPVAFGMDDADRPRIVLETVQALTGLGIDVLKLEFPGNPQDPSGWPEACAAITNAISEPWVLLSSGVTFEEYRAQLAVAFDNGCSGFTGGRAIWRPATDAAVSERAAVIAGTVADQFEDLRSLAVSSAVPWRSV